MLLLILVLQLAYFGLKYYAPNSNVNLWELDSEQQKKFDSLVLASKSKNAQQRKFFNPNYISDFKGYTLGLSALEMDRLKQFRKQDKFVNSSAEFQQITGISDSLLNGISPFFKFPDWVKRKSERINGIPKTNVTKKAVKDLNEATADELKQINGIGEKLSVRIIKFRDRLGGFLVDEQLNDVYGLESEVVERTLLRFKVLHPPQVKKININTANADELASLIYLRYNVAKNIVLYREENGPFTSLKDLSNVPEFPLNRIERIGLYLSY